MSLIVEPGVLSLMVPFNAYTGISFLVRFLFLTVDDEEITLPSLFGATFPILTGCCCVILIRLVWNCFPAECIIVDLVLLGVSFQVEFSSTSSTKTSSFIERLRLPGLGMVDRRRCTEPFVPPLRRGELRAECSGAGCREGTV